jgi:hypothetical protein
MIFPPSFKSEHVIVAAALLIWAVCMLVLYVEYTP